MREEGVRGLYFWGLMSLPGAIFLCSCLSCVSAKVGVLLTRMGPSVFCECSSEDSIQ